MGTVRKTRKTIKHNLGSARRAITDAAHTVGDVYKDAAKEIGEYLTMETQRESWERNYDSLSGQTAERRAERQAAAEEAAAKAEEDKITAEQYAALDEERRRRARSKGRSSTILAGALGDTGMSTYKKTLLGG